MEKENTTNTPEVKKEFTISKEVIQAILLGFVLALCINIIVQYFGSYQYSHGLGTFFESPFGYKSDYIRGKVIKPIFYAIESFKHFQYIAYFWIPLSLLIYFLKRYTIKIE